jgi:hypothetical protein
MIAGETSADRLSWRVQGKLRKKEKELKQSLTGCFGEFHRAMLEWLWKQYGTIAPFARRSRDIVICGVWITCRVTSGFNRSSGIALQCQRQTEMSYSLPSRNVLCGGWNLWTGV